MIDPNLGGNEQGCIMEKEIKSGGKNCVTFFLFLWVG